MKTTRRRFVGGAATLATGSAAGCVDGIGDGAGGGQNDEVYTAFFALEKFTQGVVGDALAVENPIPIGQLGHHYEVSSQAQLDVARSRALVYVDLEGFQRWAVDAATNLRQNHPEVALVDAAADVELLGADGADSDRDGDGHDEPTDDGSGDDDGHDHGDFDPHFWLDPVRAGTCVETIRDGLADAQSSNGGAFESNADDYLETLSALDGTFETELADRELDTVVVASHDSFGYLADRYDFSIHSPVGVSPNAEPAASEIAATVDVVDERGIDVVLYDAFESPTLAETVVRESSATEAVPLSSVAGTRTDWHDRGWGYVEQMKELNLPALKAALNVE